MEGMVGAGIIVEGGGELRLVESQIIDNGGSGGIGAISGTPNGGAGLVKSATRGAGGAGGPRGGP